MVSIPRLVLGAPASGHGKTTVSTGIMAALSRRGISTTGHKVGPDYIDPGYHALATGRPGRNLDPFLVGEDRVAPLLAHGAADGDVAVVEGVMGLHDGRLGTAGFSSTAHVSRLTSSPVVIVVDVSHASRTIAAMVDGVARFDAGVHVAGVILNRVASHRQSAEIRGALRTTGLAVVGELGRDSRLHVPSRHLGLVPAAERGEAAQTLETLADVVEEGIDLDALLSIARSAPALAAEPWDARRELSPVTSTSPRIAVAGGRAFTFRYAENVELLQAAGCEVVEFDPLVDESLPSGIAGLYLGGGFPEVHAAELSANRRLREDLRSAVLDGVPTVAECAGLLYLCRTLDGRPMAGVVDADAEMTSTLSLGYRSATAANDHLLAGSGDSVTGHEFHRTRVEPVSGPAAWSWQTDGARVEEGFADDALVASYLHVHWAGHRDHAQRFAAAAAEFGGRALTSAPPQEAPAQEAPTEEVRAQVEPVPSAPVLTRAAPLADPLRHHGDVEATEDVIDFAVNVHEDGPPQWLVDRIRSSADDVARYPDPTSVTAAVARHHGRPTGEVLLTAGAAEAFTLVARARPWRRPVVVHPQFTEPDVALEAAGRDVTRVVLDAENGFRLDPQAIPLDADLVVIGNPTNPTGVLHRADQILTLVRRGRLVVVDEAFMDAIVDEPESLVARRHRGLLVVRSLTKLWAIPGVRAGYVSGDPEAIDELRTHQPPWSVSAAALAATSAIVEDQTDEAGRRAAGLRSATDELVAALDKIGLTAVSGAAPFVLVRVPEGIHAALRTQGFAVRRADTFPGLDDNWIRIAVRRPATCAPLLAALETLTRSAR